MVSTPLEFVPEVATLTTNGLSVLLALMLVRLIESKTHAVIGPEFHEPLGTGREDRSLTCTARSAGRRRVPCRRRCVRKRSRRRPFRRRIQEN